ncbi:MAG: M61 family metallopeptidase [Rhodocyclaceae bacterium]|nr:M61 family metallopeptidase [Rhodocyclaceae bacterium]
MSHALQYRVELADPSGHLLRVRLTIADPDPQGQRLSLPAWIPGSYMIRDFARNIVALEARSGGRRLAVVKLDKHSWRCAPGRPGAPLEIECEIYAWDLSVRAAHFDHSHAFFNGTSVFLRAHGHEQRICLVDLVAPSWRGAEDWRVATALAEAKGWPGAAKRHGFGCYLAADYDELIDHPVEIGTFSRASFKAGGVSHEVIVTGRHDADLKRLGADLARVCEWQITLFGKPAPMKRYLFLTMVVGDGYGGLEHQASTALLASRNDLPHAAMDKPTEGYRRFLGLCSHEYFHSWNVKRIRPAAFTPYDLSREVHTSLLWAFEGITSYYDDLALVRSGVLAPGDYLEQLGRTIAGVVRGPGRLRQSLADSSFDAWTKYYRQDENAPNAIVSYYTKGALVALATDLQLRTASDGASSLDDVMRLLWRRHGDGAAGVTEGGVFDVVAEIGGDGLARWLRKAVEGTGDLPLKRLFKPFGIQLTEEPEELPSLGVRLAPGIADARLASVINGGAAHRAGLSAGDELVAIDGLRVGRETLDGHLRRRLPGDRLRVEAFRRDELRSFEVVLDPPALKTVRLKSRSGATGAQRRLQAGWLGSRAD